MRDDPNMGDLVQREREHPQNLKFVALPVPEIIAIEVLAGGCEPPVLGKRRQ